MGKHKLVPVEPTKDMVIAGGASLFERGLLPLPEDVIECCKAMLASAPEVEQESVAFCEDAALSLAERTFSADVDEQLASDIIQYARRLHSLYVAPQPAEQTSINPNLASDAAKHLTDWLEMGSCECGGVHSCGYYEVKRTRDALLVAVEQKPAPDVTQLVEVLEDCITWLEPYDDIKPRDWKTDRENLRRAHQSARAALAAYRKQGGES